MKAIKNILGKVRGIFVQKKNIQVYCLKYKCYATAVYTVYFGVFVNVKYVYNL